VYVIPGIPHGSSIHNFREQIIDVIVFTTRIDTNLHFFFALPQGRIYT
jgi:hypothetical protein